MKNFQNKKALQIGLFVLIAIVVLGVGYAAISAVNLIINGNAIASVNQNNFKVHFTQAQGITGSTGVSGTSNIDSQDDTKAIFDVTGLTKVGDYAEAVYTVRNDSNGIGTKITLNLTSSNTEYFKVTETILDNKLQAGDSTTAKVKVEMIKTPITDSVSTSVTARLTATPIENASAIDGEPKEIIKPTPLVYTVDGVNDIFMNTDISNWTGVYNNFSAAKAEFGYPYALAHDTEDGKVTASYVVFEKNNQVYYLKGRIKEAKLTDKPVYEKNVATIKEAFGQNWQSVCSYVYETIQLESFECSIDGLFVTVDNNGKIRVTNSNYVDFNNHGFCGIAYNGTDIASCYRFQ